MWSPKKIRKLSNLSAHRWAKLARAACELLVARFWFAYRPTNAIISDLQSTKAPGLNAQSPELGDISWAMDVASRHVPWRSDCLIQAMAANRWLRRYTVEPQFYLGVKKDGGNTLAAHAWLTVGDRVITGGNISGFQPILQPDQDRSAL